MDFLAGARPSFTNSPRILLTSEPLFGDPVAYITRTMDEGDAFGLTCCQKANDIQVDETDFVQVERDVRSSGLYLSFQFLYMLPPHAANQPQRRRLSIRIFLDS